MEISRRFFFFHGKLPWFLEGCAIIYYKRVTRIRYTVKGLYFYLPSITAALENLGIHTF